MTDLSDKPSIRLFTVFLDPPPEPRADEIRRCLLANCEHPGISEVHFYTRKAKWLPSHPKLRVVTADYRPVTYSVLFSDANSILQSPQDISIIANADIRFDDTLNGELEVLTDQICFALTRWNDEPGGVVFWNRCDSQDAWLFRGEIRPVAANFEIGLLGCDNRIAHELQRAGYRVLNPSPTIRAIHLHRTAYYSPRRDKRVGPPYLRVHPIPLRSNAPKKVLHIALNYRTPQRGLIAALKSIGEYQELDWIALSEANGTKGIHKAIDEVAAWAPDLTFMQVQGSRQFGPVPSEVKKLGVVVNYTGDARQPMPFWYAQAAENVTITCFSDMDSVEALRARGFKSKHMHMGFDNRTFRPDGNRGKWPEIVFLGNDYNNTFPLSELRRTVATRLRIRYGHRFGVFGTFPGATGNLMFNETAEAECLRSCKIAVGISHLPLRRYTSDRLWRSMGCGALYACHRFPEMEVDFKEGTHLAGWTEPEELCKLIDFYLEHEDDRAKIAKQGCDLVHKNHTWDARMDQLLEIYQECQEGVKA